MLITDYFAEYYKVPTENIAVIGGPCHAEEIALERLSYITLACSDIEKVRTISPVFNNHPELPVFDGELLMDVHGTGCYTSQAAMKLYNRQNEQLGDAAERAAVAAEWLGTASYPQHTLTEAWKRFIFHQFHDDLTGTSIPRAYEFSWNDELISLKQFSQVLTSSVNAIAGQLDPRVKGTPVVLYNANAPAWHSARAHTWNRLSGLYSDTPPPPFVLHRCLLLSHA